MRLIEVILLASSLVVVQAKAIDKDETRIWIKRQFAPTNSTDDANCVKETITETLRETVTVNAAGGVPQGNVQPTVTVTMAASDSTASDGGFDAKKFEGLRLSTITETVVGTAVPETITVQEVGSTVTQMLTIVAEALPVAFTITEIVTEAVSAPIVTVTETLTIAGAPIAPVTITESVQGTCQPSAASTAQDAPDAVSSATAPVGLPNGNGVGVSTVPIAESALPTTTFDLDPLATSSQIASPTTPSLSSVAANPSVVSSDIVGETTSSTATIVTAPLPVVGTPSGGDSATASLGDADSTGASSVADSSPTPISSPEPATSELVEDTTLVTESSAITSSLSSVASDPASASEIISESTAIETTSSIDSVTTTETSSAEDLTATATSAAEGTTATEPSLSEGTTTTETPSPSQPLETSITQEPSSAANSLNLGGIAPDTTAKIESAVSQDPQASGGAVGISGGALILPQINVSTLTFSSALELGNLMGVAVTPTATATPTVAAQAQATERVSSMALNMLG